MYEKEKKNEDDHEKNIQIKFKTNTEIKAYDKLIQDKIMYYLVEYVDEGNNTQKGWIAFKDQNLHYKIYELVPMPCLQIIHIDDL